MIVYKPQNNTVYGIKILVNQNANWSSQGPFGYFLSSSCSLCLHISPKTPEHPVNRPN